MDIFRIQYDEEDAIFRNSQPPGEPIFLEAGCNDVELSKSHGSPPKHAQCSTVKEYILYFLLLLLPCALCVVQLHVMRSSALATPPVLHIETNYLDTHTWS